MTEDVYDVLIVGAGPAGATAAYALAKAERTVCLVDAESFPRDRVCAGWLSSQAKPLLAELGLSPRDVTALEFKSVAFFNADLTKTASPNLSGSAGYLVNRAAFDECMVNNAVAAGADFRQGVPVRDVALEEGGVAIDVEDAGKLRARLLVLATGRGTPLLERVGLTIEADAGGAWAAQVETTECPPQSAPSVSVVLGVDASGGFGMVVASEGFASVGIQSPGDRRDVIPNLVTLCRRVVEAKLLDVDLSRTAAAAPVTVTPTAVALSMDTHVAKRALVVGDAGGFVAAASGEGIYPAMWSARIACDVLLKALEAPSPQDALMEFDTSWRMQMADYLRAPNTDTQYILPLIFTNQPMADRMGAAFFAGENI
jgi:flavin-dependent dehydrogenase